MRKFYKFKLKKMGQVSKVFTGFLFLTILLFQSVSAVPKTVHGPGALSGISSNKISAKTGIVSPVYAYRVSQHSFVPGIFNNTTFSKNINSLTAKNNAGSNRLGLPTAIVNTSLYRTSYGLIDFSLTVTTSGDGTVTKDPDQTDYATDASVVLKAEPGAGQQFTGWSGDANGTANPLTIIMDANKSVTANFAPIPPAQYNLTINIDGNGSVTKDPEQTDYTSGSTVQLTATPAAGQQFTGWSGAATGTANPLTITMDANKTLTATFAPIPAAQYTLSININGNGTVARDPNQPDYTDGSTVSLTATPAAGQQFTGWSGAATGTSNPLSVTMDGNKTVTATFAPIEYTVTLSVNGNGTVTKSPDQATYASGAEVTLTAIPASGQKFVSWSDGVNTSTVNPLTITITSNRSGVATFAPITYTLNASANGSGTVNSSPAGPTFDAGTEVTITATPAAGFKFTGWSGNSNSTTNPLTILMDADKSLVANFAEVTYTLTTTPNDNGTIVLNPLGPVYNSGTVVTVTATAANGYQFTGWTGSASGNTNPLNITMDADKTVGATFTLIPPLQHTLTINTTGTGTVSKAPDQPSYSNGTSVTLTATPGAGQQFTGWSGSVNSSTNPLTITMDADKTITATFSPVTYTLTIATSGNGTVSKNPDQVAYNSGTSVTVTATPGAGQQFTGWSGAIASNANPLTVTMDGDKSLTATFAPLPTQFSLSVNTSGSGTVSKNPDQATYASGTIVTLTATPGAGQQFAGWSGAVTSTVNPLTVTMDANKTITASFTPLQYTLTVSATGGGSVGKSPNQATYASGTSVTITATPTSGQQFTGWSGDATGATNPLTVVMSGNKNIIANFTQSSSGIITNITATTGNSYVLGQLIVGAVLYSDRTYQATSVPAILNNAPFIKTPNSDKSNKSTSALSFTLTKSATVYVAYDPRATALPAWLSSFQKLAIQLGLNDPGITHLLWYSKNFPAGKVTLGGNIATPAAGALNNYIVAAVALPTQYALTVTTSGNGTVSKNPDQVNYLSGTNVILTATPAAGQQFTGWSGAVTSTTNPLTITMDADKAITATFAPVSAQYTLAVNTTGNGTTTKNPDQATYLSGTNVTLTAIPAAGQQFTGWSGDTTSIANPIAIVMNANKTVTANFAPIPPQRTLTLDITGNGSVSKNPDQATYTSGTNVTLTATPAAGQQFTGWSGAVTSTTNPLTINMDADKSITASFAPIQYALTVTVSGNGTVNKNPDQATYTAGTDVILTATPAAGQQFTGWSGAVTSTVNPLTVTMDAVKNITATFVPIQYTLAVNISGNGTVNKNPSQATYPSGASVVLTATPAAGQQFTGWSGAVTSTANPLTITMDADKTVTATFAPIQYALTININGNGTVTKDPDQATYDNGANVVITAVPGPGQQFTGWSGAVTSTANPLTINMNAAKSVTANFAPAQYSLTVIVSGKGSVTKNPDQASYVTGTSVVLTATPAAGQQFMGWTGAVTSSTNPLTIPMDATKSVTATFAPLQYTLNVTTNGNGTVSKNPAQPTYPSGASVILTATPAAGQQFTGWSGDVTTATNPLTVTVESAMNVTANFAPAQYALVVNISGSGAVSKNPDQLTYTSGSSVTLTAIPSAGQQFTGWSGAVTSSTNPLTVTMDAGKTITATFEPIQYNVTVSITGNGTVTKNPNQTTYSSGSNLTLTATPAAGQQFTGWSGDATGTANPLTVLVNSNKNITATFAAVTTSLITNVVATSANPYAIGQLVVGTTVYTDRAYTVTSVPAFLNNAACIKTPNADKSNKTTNLLSFNLTQAAVVYVGYDPRSTVLPAWLSSWQKLATQVGFNDPGISGLALYSKAFAAGKVTIGGNLATPAAGALDNYFVMAVKPAQFSLAVATNGGGTVSKSPDQVSYDAGSSVTLTATPAAGQQFNGWSGDAGGTTNPLILVMDANKSVTANFGPIQYTLTVNVTGTGTVTKNPNQPSYPGGTNVTLTATPAAGQQFVGWSGDASGTTNPLIVTLNVNKVITANFISTSLITNITATTANPYALGQLVVGTTVYTDRAYTVTSVPAFLNNAACIKTPNVDKTNKTTNLLSFNLSQAATVYVGYDPRGTVLPAWLSGWQKLTTEIGFNDPGITGLALYSKSFPAGKVTIGGNLASPASGALDNYLVVAAQVPLYTLITTANGSGTVTKTPDQASYPSGSSVTLTATPASNQQFTGWSGDATGKTNPLVVVMNSNKSIAATFAQGTKSVFFTQSSQTAEVEQGASQDLLEYISTSDNTPSNTKLTAIDEGGNIPTWLSVNGVILNGISYTSNSEITFTFDATNLSVGTYTATVTASSTGYNSAVLELLLTVKQASTGVLTNVKINFADSATIPPTGYLRDYGQAFGARSSAYQGTGYSYGWLKKADNTPLNLTKNGRNRGTPADILQATLLHMQANHLATFTGTKIEGIWEAQVNNGNYDVTVSVGDGSQVDSKHSINVEGVPAISLFVPTTATRFKSATVTVSVADGFLTLDATGGTNTKINYVIIKPSTSKRPSVIDVNPENSSQNVSENTSISTSILNLPNGGIDNSTITTSNVFLSEEGTAVLIPANVNGTGGGDAITLVPLAPLKLNTSYIFNITSGVKDLSGASFIPYSSIFTTGSGSTTETIAAKFDKVSLPNAKGNHSSLTIGPDGKMYALCIDGLIKRFTINNDGTLGTPDSLYALQDAYGTRKQTLAISLAFDPASTAGNLIAWITHSSTYVFLNAPPWDGKLSKLTGANLQNVQDVVINLPRSSKDHVTNSIAFGPDGKLYFTQASTSAMGSADGNWNNRAECLLSASVLRLDVSKLGALPLDAKTPDGGGSYNPYAANAPLTIYASGIRNAYDLIWHSNGSLYTPTNGSAAGGNTPASVNGTLRPDGSHYNGPVIPALNTVQQTQKDFLFRVVKGGFYGHPNPLRGEYVLNGGNPTSAIDPAQVNAYPVGTMPDVNWRGYAFDFQSNASPNGAIEYKSNTFDGALKGKILVVRYSQHDDIITLTPGGTDNDIISAIDGISIPGFSGFNDPLNLTEDLKTGNLYVSEYGGGKIDLLRVNNTVSRPNDSTSLVSDAFVRSDAYGDANYGTDTSLLVKGNSKSAGLARLTYLKFPLGTLTNVTSAKLRVYGNNQEDTTKVNVSVHSVANDSWTEKKVTYNNGPAGSATALSTVGVNNVAKYYEFDVTAFIKTEASGDKVVSLLLKDATNKNKKIVFNSKENARFKPQLVIVANGKTITLGAGAAPAATATEPASRKSEVPAAAKTPVVSQTTNADSITLFSLEEMPYLAEHNFEKPRLYPNPFHNVFNIEFPSKYQGNFTIEIIDLFGRVYKIGNPRLKVGGSNMEVNISKLMLKPGTYFLKILSGTGKNDTIKLIIK